MSYSADEPYDVRKKTIRRARVPHRCSACRAILRPGHRYAHVSLVYDGTAETVKRCGRCERTHQHLVDLCRGTDMWPAEKLDCGLRYADEWFEEPPAEIADLPFSSGDDASLLLEQT